MKENEKLMIDLIEKPNIQPLSTKTHNRVHSS